MSRIKMMVFHFAKDEISFRPRLLPCERVFPGIRISLRGPSSLFRLYFQLLFPYGLFRLAIAFFFFENRLPRRWLELGDGGVLFQKIEDGIRLVVLVQYAGDDGHGSEVARIPAPGIAASGAN